MINQDNYGEPKPHRIILRMNQEYESGYSAASDSAWETRKIIKENAIAEYSKHSINLKEVDKVTLARIKQAVVGTDLEAKVDKILKDRK